MNAKITKLVSLLGLLFIAILPNVNKAKAQNTGYNIDYSGRRIEGATLYREFEEESYKYTVPDGVKVQLLHNRKMTYKRTEDGEDYNFVDGFDSKSIFSYEEHTYNMDLEAFGGLYKYSYAVWNRELSDSYKNKELRMPSPTIDESENGRRNGYDRDRETDAYEDMLKLNIDLPSGIFVYEITFGDEVLRLNADEQSRIKEYFWRGRLSENSKLDIKNVPIRIKFKDSEGNIIREKIEPRPIVKEESIEKRIKVNAVLLWKENGRHYPSTIDTENTNWSYFDAFPKSKDLRMVKNISANRYEGDYNMTEDIHQFVWWHGEEYDLGSDHHVALENIKLYNSQTKQSVNAYDYYKNELGEDLFKTEDPHLSFGSKLNSFNLKLLADESGVLRYDSIVLEYDLQEKEIIKTSASIEFIDSQGHTIANTPNGFNASIALNGGIETRLLTEDLGTLNYFAKVYRYSYHSTSDRYKYSKGEIVIPINGLSYTVAEGYDIWLEDIELIGNGADTGTNLSLREYAKRSGILPNKEDVNNMIYNTAISNRDYYSNLIKWNKLSPIYISIEKALHSTGFQNIKFKFRVEKNNNISFGTKYTDETGRTIRKEGADGHYKIKGVKENGILVNKDNNPEPKKTKVLNIEKYTKTDAQGDYDSVMINLSNINISLTEELRDNWEAWFEKIMIGEKDLFEGLIKTNSSYADLFIKANTLSKSVDELQSLDSKEFYELLASISNNDLFIPLHSRIMGFALPNSVDLYFHVEGIASLYPILKDKNIENGRIELSEYGILEAGTRVDITVEANDGYELESLYLNGKKLLNNYFFVRGRSFVSAKFVKSIVVNENSNSIEIENLESYKGQEVELYDVYSGHLYNRYKVDADSLYIDTTNLAGGIYILKLSDSKSIKFQLKKK